MGCAGWCVEDRSGTIDGEEWLVCLEDLFMSIKEAVLEAVRQLPDDAGFEDVLDQIETLAAIRRGEEDADAGRVVPHDEVKRRIASWITR
jgi:predicted transcriptional regulator